MGGAELVGDIWKDVRWVGRRAGGVKVKEELVERV